MPSPGNQWVVLIATPTEWPAYVYGPFDNEGLAKAFATAYEAEHTHDEAEAIECNTPRADQPKDL